MITDTGGEGEGGKTAFRSERTDGLYTSYGLFHRYGESVFGSETVFSPGLLLAVWAAGTAGAGAAVAWWRIVGHVYHRLGAAVVILIGAGAWFFDPHPLAALGVAAAAAALAGGRHPSWTTAGLGSAAVFLTARAMLLGSGAAQAAAAVTGAAALGGITVGMLLGHWYLVSPRIPRWALRALSLGGAAGVISDALLLGLWAGLEGGPLPLTAFFALAAVSALLMAATWFALGEPSYTGVMAATGLGYLAVLTALGSTALGRTLALG